jgi:RNA polymerase sigma factor (sigma-70 family)
MAQTSLASVLRYLRNTYDLPQSQDLTDSDLLERFLTSHDEAAFTLLVQRHGPMVLGVCRRVLGDIHSAEDSFQATFLVLVRRAASIRKKQSVGSWLHGVAQRIALRSRAKAALRSQRETQSAQMPRSEALDALTCQELRTVLDEEIGLLPETCRAAIVLCHLEGKTLNQAAPELGWPRGSLANRLARGRQLLRQRLARRGITLSAAALASTLGHRASAAALTASLTIRTVKAAVSLAAGKSVAAGCLSTHAVAMAEEAIKGMPTLGAKVVLLLLALGLVLGGAGIGSQTGGTPESTAIRAETPIIPQAGDESKKAAGAAVDLHGDPLPDGAVARLGTVRFRHAVLTSKVVFAQGDKVLASAGGDLNGFYVCLWDAPTGRLLHRLPNTNGSSTLAVSADGKALVTGDLRLIDTATGKELRRLDGPVGYIGAIACSPDGQTVAAAQASAEPAKVVLWDFHTGKQLRRLAANTDSVTSVAFAPDSMAVAYANADGTIFLWDVASGKEIRRFDGHAKVVRAIAFGGKLLASAGSDRTVRLWDVDTGKELRRLHGDSPVVFAPDGKTLACADNQGDIHLWDALTGTELRHWSAYNGGSDLLISLAFSPDGKQLASTGHYDHAIRLWEVATGKEIRPTNGHTGVVRTLRFAADGKSLVSTAVDNEAIQWDLTTGRQRHRLFADGPLGRLQQGWYWNTPDLSPDGKVLAVIGCSRNGKEFKQDPVIRLWDTATAKLLHTFNAVGARSVAFSSDNKTVAADSRDGIHLWDVATGKEMRHLTGPPAHRGTVVFAPDDRRLVWAAEDRTIRVCEVATGKELSRWESGKIELLVFSPDGSDLAGARKGEVFVWSVANGKALAQFRGLDWVYSLAFSPSGRTLAAGGIANRPQGAADAKATCPIYLWELWTGQEIRRIDAIQGSVAALAFSADGRILASGGNDSTILLWDLGASPGAKKAALPTPAAMNGLWLDLGTDAAKADRALWGLVREPKESVPLLKERLRPPVPANADQIAKLIADLDSPSFAARQKAGQALENLGEAAEGALRKTLAGSVTLEVRQRLEQILEKSEREAVRRLRAIETLEHIWTDEARQILENLAKNAVHPRVAQAATAATQRLSKRVP